VTQEPSRSGQDPIGDFQRWLFRSGARSVSREVSDQIRSMLGRSGGPADVWARATAPPADEAPECAWCPICRAARVLRESGPGVGSQMAAAGEAVGVLARDAVSVVESALAATGRAARAGTAPGQAPASTIWADVTAEAGETVPGPADAVPDPGDAVPDPGDAVPDRGDAVPGPGDAAPDPGHAMPGPGDAAPDPGKVVPGPAGAVPDPGDEPESAGPPGGPPHEPDDRG
jgi:hypothetical protein